MADLEAPLIGALLKPHLLRINPVALSQETGYAKGSWYSWLTGAKAMPRHLFDRLVATLPLDPEDVAVARLEATDSVRRPHHKGQTNRPLPPASYPLTQALFSPHTGRVLELSQRYGYAPETWTRWLKGQRQMPEPLFDLAVERFHLTWAEGGRHSVEEARAETKGMMRYNRPRPRFQPQGERQPVLPPPRSFSEALSWGGTGTQPVRLDKVDDPCVPILPPASFYEAVQAAAHAFHPTPREVHQTARWLMSGGNGVIEPHSMLRDANEEPREGAAAMARRELARRETFHETAVAGFEAQAGRLSPFFDTA